MTDTIAQHLARMTPAYAAAFGYPEIRRHFAHKHRHGCRYGRESIAVLMARACLYKWLQTSFPGGVTVEKDLGDDAIPHPVDCWV